MFGRMSTVAFVGIEARPVHVEVRITPGKHVFAVVGLPDKAVAESRERVRNALQRDPVPHRRVAPILRCIPGVAEIVRRAEEARLASLAKGWMGAARNPPAARGRDEVLGCIGQASHVAPNPLISAGPGTLCRPAARMQKHSR